MSIVSITSNTLCLQFTLVDGTTTHDVHMHLECGQCPIILIILLTAALNDNVDIRCFGDIPPNNWTLLACDGKDTYCNNPAVVLTDIDIPLILPSSIQSSSALTVVLTDINIPLILPSSIGKAMFVDDHYKFNVFI